MCVFKYHAFIYFLRPPPWYGTCTTTTDMSILLTHHLYFCNHIIEVFPQQFELQYDGPFYLTKTSVHFRTQLGTQKFQFCTDITSISISLQRNFISSTLVLALLVMLPKLFHLHYYILLFLLQRPFHFVCRIQFSLLPHLFHAFILGLLQRSCKLLCWIHWSVVTLELLFQPYYHVHYSAPGSLVHFTCHFSAFCIRKV
jgi:hypothetical protein